MELPYSEAVYPGISTTGAARGRGYGLLGSSSETLLETGYWSRWKFILLFSIIALKVQGSFQDFEEKNLFFCQCVFKKNFFFISQIGWNSPKRTGSDLGSNHCPAMRPILG